MRDGGGRRCHELTAIWVAALVAAALAGGCGSSAGEQPSAEGAQAPAGETQTISFQEPEDPGPEPFTEPADVEGPEEVPLPQSGPFGGSGSDKVCDRDKLIRYLKENPDRLREWARVVGVKPTYSAVSKYIAKLHPVTLARDTQVTNHSFKDGRAVPFQAILQAGTAVLVDKHGRPVARCRCGNPLAEPVFEKTARCTGCPAGYKPPKQCTFYKQKAGYDKRIYTKDYYGNDDYDRTFIDQAADGPYDDCWIVYPDPPTVTIIDVYREPQPEPEPVQPQPAEPPAPPRTGPNCDNPRSQEEFELCHPPQTAPSDGGADPDHQPTTEEPPPEEPPPGGNHGPPRLPECDFRTDC